jgi:integrase
MAYVHTRPESRYWHFFFQHAGRVYRGSTGIAAYGAHGRRTVNKQQARDVAGTVKRYVQSGDIDGLRALGQHKLADRLVKLVSASQPAEIRVVRFLDAFAQYLAEFKVDARPSAGYLKLIEAYWFPRWNALWPDVKSVTEQALRDYKRRRLSEVKPNTLHKELVVLRKFLVWCGKKRYIDTVPALSMPRGKSQYRPETLTRQQVEDLLAALPDCRTPYGVSKQKRPVREFFTFLYFQGLRSGTVKQAAWSDILQKDGRWYFHIRAETDKARWGRVVPLHPRSVAALQSLGIGKSGLIFGACDYRAVLRSVLKRLKLPMVRVHDFRHSRLDELVQKTTDIGAVQYLAGHKDIQTTQIYLHPDVSRAERLFDDE